MSIEGITDAVAVVTGAAQGIGAVVAQALAAGGAKVAAVDIKLSGSDGPMTTLGPGAHAYACDVRDSSAVNTLVKRVEHEMGPIKVLVNVAGVLRTGPIVEMSDEDWATVFDVNTNGVFNMCRAAARYMIHRRGGAIITVGSNAGGVPRMHMSAYAASKAATAMFTRCLGLELAQHAIRCNVVAPGSTHTDMLTSMWTESYGLSSVIEGDQKIFRTGIPLRRVAEPQDIADAVLFLASDRARHITMQVLYVDGGAALQA
jgi:2,3-dihydro-2,3-dihydroxybenzoate dehydrogenase